MKQLRWPCLEPAGGNQILSKEGSLRRRRRGDISKTEKVYLHGSAPAMPIDSDNVGEYYSFAMMDY